jgi:outer membrane protein TolC
VNAPVAANMMRLPPVSAVENSLQPQPRRIPPVTHAENGPAPVAAGQIPAGAAPVGLQPAPMPGGRAPAPVEVACAAPPMCDPETVMYTAPYQQRVAGYPDRESYPVPAGEAAALPSGYEPWWSNRVRVGLRPGSRTLAVNVENLVLGALANSPDILSVQAETEARQTGVERECGQFDWRAFVDATYNFVSDPVGNELTTGGPPRYRDRDWDIAAGVRKRVGLGGEVEISQQIGSQYNNSRFFVPPNQGQTRLEISFTQPLLAKAGGFYNNSRIVLAQIDGEIARNDLQKKLQQHSVQVAEAYWEVYRARATRLQKQRLYDRAVSILELLKAREEIDAVQRQVLRAEAAVASRRSDITRSAAAIRNAESQLRLLVNDPQLFEGSQLELIPVDLPRPDRGCVSLRTSLEAALYYRPDVAQAVREIRAACVRLGVAKNELLPRLDFIVSTYVAGLEGEADVGQALGNQFSVGEPGYTVGLLFEVPLGNRTARAEYARRQAELDRATFAFRSTVETGLTEVELAVREVETSYQEMVGRYQAMVAADAEEKYLYQRWRLIPGHDGATPYLLEDVLDAQDRLADEETAFVLAQVNHVLALAYLKRATGTLLRFDEGQCGREHWYDVPEACARRHGPVIGQGQPMAPY